MPRRKKTHHLVAQHVSTGPPVITQAVMEVFEPLDDDSPCYALVGLIAAETARIEHYLDQSLCNLAEIQKHVGACFTGQIVGPGPRFNAMLQLARERRLPKEIIDRIKNLDTKAHPIFDRRNRAVHDPWWRSKTSGKPHQFRGKPRKLDQFGLMPKTENELRDDLTEIRKYAVAVRRLVSDIWTALRQS